MIGMNGTTPYRSSAMVQALNAAAAQDTARLRERETLHLPSLAITDKIPPRDMGLFSRLTMGLKQAQASHQAAARAYAQNR